MLNPDRVSPHIEANDERCNNRQAADKDHTGWEIGGTARGGIAISLVGVGGVAQAVAEEVEGEDDEDHRA